jgi:hypothetical protein
MTHEEPLDEDDDDDLGEEDDEDDEVEEKTGIASVHRLSSVDTWEMYRVLDEDTGLPIASIGVSAPRNGVRVVDYAVWRAGDVEDPSWTGSLHRKADRGSAAAEWDDRAREEVLRQVLHHHEAGVGVPHDKADFRLAPPDASADDEPEDES